jgi:lactate racemase
MVSCGTIAHNLTSAIFITGAREPGFAMRMGCIPKDNFKDSLTAAEKYVGTHTRILVLPVVFVKPRFHTFRK